ncbi:MAG: hypothetical protein M1820_001866 [Bogoriella megaspora]|nr:MAG: hypothetical protein M1820_001866 [Bogoriella megaspora]
MLHYDVRASQALSLPHDRLHRLTDRVRYHAYTIWLFNVNDFKTIVFPSTLFALFYSISIDKSPGTLVLLARLPKVFLWTWTNLLTFTVNNQRQPLAITEDALNKPWRPLPSGRLTPSQAYYLSLFTYALSITVSLLCGAGLIPCLLLFCFGYLHNDLGLGDVDPIARNALNGCGFSSFAAGATEIALHVRGLDRDAIIWLNVIAAVVFCTIHTQDMYDQVGDKAVGRRTAPLVIGDGAARWSIAIAILGWSLAAPACLGAAKVASVFPVVMGLWIMSRTLGRRCVVDDRKTFKIYNAWLVSLYMLPLVKGVAM